MARGKHVVKGTIAPWSLHKFNWESAFPLWPGDPKRDLEPLFTRALERVQFTVEALPKSELIKDDERKKKGTAIKVEQAAKSLNIALREFFADLEPTQIRQVKDKIAPSHTGWDYKAFHGILFSLRDLSTDVERALKWKQVNSSLTDERRAFLVDLVQAFEIKGGTVSLNTWNEKPPGHDEIWQAFHGFCMSDHRIPEAFILEKSSFRNRLSEICIELSQDKQP